MLMVTGLVKDQACVAAFAVLLRVSNPSARQAAAEKVLPLFQVLRDGPDRRVSHRAEQLYFLIEHNLLDEIIKEAPARWQVRREYRPHGDKADDMQLPELALAIDTVHSKHSNASRARAAKKSVDRSSSPSRTKDLGASQLRYTYDTP